MKKTQILVSGTEMVHGSKTANGHLLDEEEHYNDPFPNRLTAEEKKAISKLTNTERERWLGALKTIEEGWKTVLEVGRALKEIRESRLYRENYDSWEAFCRNVVGISKTEANRQIIDAEVTTELVTPNGVTNDAEILPLPANRAQTRILAKIKDPKERRRIWEQVTAVSETQAITAQVIEAAIPSNSKKEQSRRPSNRRSDKVEAPPLPETVIAGLDVLETLRIAPKERDWSHVDDVIRHLESTEFTSNKTFEIK